MNYFVVDVGGTFVKYAVMNAEGEFIEKGKFPSIADDRQRFLDSIETQFFRKNAAYRSQSRMMRRQRHWQSCGEEI